MSMVGSSCSATISIAVICSWFLQFGQIISTSFIYASTFLAVFRSVRRRFSASFRLFASSVTSAGFMLKVDTLYFILYTYFSPF